jgi:hypothetical protein
LRPTAFGYSEHTPPRAWTFALERADVPEHGNGAGGGLVARGADQHSTRSASSC